LHGRFRFGLCQHGFIKADLQIFIKVLFVIASAQLRVPPGRSLDERNLLPETQFLLNTVRSHSNHNHPIP
jgi:hypothetical protein